MKISGTLRDAPNVDMRVHISVEDLLTNLTHTVNSLEAGSTRRYFHRSDVKLLRLLADKIEVDLDSEQ